MVAYHFTHDIDGLANDCLAVAVRAPEDLSGVVRSNVKQGNVIAQGFARQMSGPHGTSYWKRMSSEMTGALSGEYGPHAGGIPVGGGWRHGAGNTDLARSADTIGPKFADDVDDAVDKWFW